MCKLNSHALLCESIDDVPGTVRTARLYCRSNFLAARLTERQSLSYHAMTFHIDGSCQLADGFMIIHIHNTHYT